MALAGIGTGPCTTPVRVVQLWPDACPHHELASYMPVMAPKAFLHKHCAASAQARFASESARAAELLESAFAKDRKSVV